MNFRSLIRSTALAMAFIVGSITLATSAFAAKDPADFKGKYQLTKAHYGYCESTIEIYPMNDDVNFIDIYAGSRFFTNVNGGRYVRDSQFVHNVSKAYTTNNSIVEDEVSYDKILKIKVTSHLSVTFSKGLKTMKLMSRTSNFPNLPTSCSYKLLPEDDSPIF